MARFRMKSGSVEAFLYQGAGQEGLSDWLQANQGDRPAQLRGADLIFPGETETVVRPGEYVVKAGDGGLYAMAAPLFELSFKPGLVLA